MTKTAHHINYFIINGRCTIIFLLLDLRPSVILAIKSNDNINHDIVNLELKKFVFNYKNDDQFRHLQLILSTQCRRELFMTNKIGSCLKAINFVLSQKKNS